jgi:hypothetical protein
MPTADPVRFVHDRISDDIRGFTCLQCDLQEIAVKAGFDSCTHTASCSDLGDDEQGQVRDHIEGQDDDFVEGNETERQGIEGVSGDTENPVVHFVGEVHAEHAYEEGEQEDAAIENRGP